MIRKIALLFCIMLVSLGQTLSQSYVDWPNFSIGHISLEEGLVNNFVTDIAQDRHGFMWFATESGLCRFDGENFKTFSMKNSDIKGNSVSALFYDDKTDKLWIGTKMGLCIYNCASRRFEDAGLPEDLKGVNIVRISRAADGGIWILNHYNYFLHVAPDSGHITTYHSKDIKGLPDAFFSLADAGNGILYIGHASLGFSAVDLKTRKAKNFMKASDENGGLSGSTVRSVFIDSYKNVWVGTDCGLALFNPGTEKFKHFPEVAFPDTQAAPNICDIKQMSDNMLWLGSDMGGVMVFDPRFPLSEDGYKFHTLPVGRYIGGLSASDAWRLYQDSFDNIWIASLGGGLSYVPGKPPVFTEFSKIGKDRNSGGEKQVWSVYVDNQSNVWVGDMHEVEMIDSRGKSRIYRFDDGINGPVKAMTGLGDSMLLSVYGYGIYKLDIKTGAMSRIPMGYPQNDANSFYNLSDGRVLMGAQDGLYEYAGGEIRQLETITKQIPRLIPNGIEVDRQGNLWIGTYGYGIFVFNRNNVLVHHITVEKGLSSNAIIQLLCDSRGKMWIAGQDGLDLIQNTRNPVKIKRFGYADGLDDIYVKALAEDNDGNIWISTNSALTEWKASTGKLETYDIGCGIPANSFIDRAAACDRKTGMMYFGSLRGACCFNPENLPITSGKVSVKIADCRSLADSEDANGLLLPEEGCVEVPYNENSLRMDFTVPDVSINKAVEYFYMVEGLDNKWIPAGKDHSAVLRNLAPGKYTLKVKARLINQPMSEAGMTQLMIVVHPPIWLTWYAKLFYVLLALGAVWYIARFYKRRLELRNSLDLERRKSIDQQELNEERLRFYTNITHELRTPLTLILGPLEDLMMDASMPAVYKKKVCTIHSSGQRLLDLINQILEFRKTETQNRKLTVARGNLSENVMEIGLRYKELNRNANVEIKLDIESGIDGVYFDADVIHTVLNNLLSNALKYTPQGRIVLSLHRLTAPDGDRIQIKVSDTGYGIDEKALPHIFDRYYQADGKHQASGSGIGLALVRSLSDLHQAELEVKSEVGEGTEFSFTLKADNVYPDALHADRMQMKKSEPEAVAHDAESEDSVDGRPLVLVVEDNDDIREYIESSLSGNYQVLTACNGKEGLAVAVDKIPDVIISDIMMPVMDGVEMCRLVKEDLRTSHIPVILLTAKDSLRDKEVGYEVGADSYLTKPFSARLLENRIANILKNRELLAKSVLKNANLTADAATHTSAGDVATDARTYTAAAPEEVKPERRLSRLDEEFVAKFTKIVEDNIDREELDMIFMQKSMNMSHSTLYRKIKGITGMSGIVLIRKIRLRRSMEMLHEGYNVSETAYACGFNDPGYFRNCFKEEFGLSPSQYVKSLNEESSKK